MKGTSKTFEILLIGLVVSILVAVGLIAFGILNTDSVKKYIAGEGPKVLSSGEFSRQYTFCELNCDPLTKKTCTKRLCEKDKTCTTKSGKIIDPTCAEVYGMADNYKPPATTGGTTAEAASFEGAFLPGGTVKIVLPDWVKEGFDKAKFKILISGDTIPADKKECIETTTDSALCKVSYPADPKEPISIVIPYMRDSKNIEERIVEGKPYTIQLYKQDDPAIKPCNSKISISSKDYCIVGSRTFTWVCPQPQFYPTAPTYEPKETVVFGFPSVKIDDTQTTTAKVEVGKRYDTSSSWWTALSAALKLAKAGCFELSGATYTAKNTCSQGITAVTSPPPPPGEKRYKFEMPYVVPDAEVEISYPVYVENIDIKDSDGAKQPICRSGKEKFVWRCPEKVCSTETSKVFVFSRSSSGTYVPGNPGCKYAKGDECSGGGCRTASALGEDNTPIKSAECVLPKPDISNAFVLYQKGTAAPTYEYGFDEIKGTYTKNEDFILTPGNHDTTKSIVAVIKNTAPPADALMGNTEIKASDITVGALIEGKSLGGTPYPFVRLYKDGIVWKCDSLLAGQKRGKIDCAKVTAVGTKTSIEVMLEKSIGSGAYFEYEIPISGITDLPLPITHTGTVSVAVSSGTKIAADSWSSSPRPVSYTVFGDSCADCSGINTEEECAGKVCGDRCKWVGPTGETARCTKK